jgi:hypothetical protein
LAKPVLSKTSFGETSAANAVPESVRVALAILNRRADQQCLVDGIAQLNGGRGGATQMGHRDGNDIGTGSPDGMTMPAASMTLIRPSWFPNVGQNSKKMMEAEGRSRTGVKTSLVASGPAFLS